MGSTVASCSSAATDSPACGAATAGSTASATGWLRRLTHDHSQVQSLVDRGLLTPEEASNQPMANVIPTPSGSKRHCGWTPWRTRSSPETLPVVQRRAQRVVTDREIARHLDLAQPATANRRLLELAMSRGAPDNVTIVTVACKEMTALRLVAEC